MTARAVNDEILNLAVLRELLLQHLLRDVRPHTVAPHALGRHGQAEGQAHPLPRNQLRGKMASGFLYGCQGGVPGTELLSIQP